MRGIRGADRAVRVLVPEQGRLHGRDARMRHENAHEAFGAPGVALAVVLHVSS